MVAAAHTVELIARDVSSPALEAQAINVEALDVEFFRNINQLSSSLHDRMGFYDSKINPVTTSTAVTVDCLLRPTAEP